MTYLADTDVLANWLRGREEDVLLLSSLSSDGLAISLITYGEIYDGIFSGHNTTANKAAFEQFLRWIDVLPLNRQIMQRFARIRGRLRRAGQIISDPDILIAATAIHHDLTILTHNIRHFERVPELKLHPRL